MNNRLNILYKKLMNGDITAEALALLRKVIQAVQSENYAMAKKYNGDLSLTAWGKNKEWLQMLKRILQFKETQPR